MHIMLVADGRSPITRRWIRGLKSMHHEVTLVSTAPFAKIEGVQSVHVLPVAFSSFGGSQVGKGEGTKAASKPGMLKRLVARYRAVFQAARNFLGPLTVLYYAFAFRRLVEKTNPDLVHALRIPYEGMLGSYTPAGVPYVVSIWGNDLTLHAPSSALMGWLTRKALQRADGLITDVKRDIRLSRQWGFLAERPTLVALTSGGIDLVEIHKLRTQSSDTYNKILPVDVPIIVNPRGLRPRYVRNDIFFQAIPMLLERWQKFYVVCPSMAGQSQAIRWIEKYKISEYVRLLPFMNQSQLWELFARSAITVSLTTHDGTPNTLLEAMVCGCFPIAGDIESLREWIVPGVNGLLVEPSNPQALAEAMHLALENTELREKAAEYNMKMVRERAEVGLVRSQLEVFYQRIVSA